MNRRTALSLPLIGPSLGGCVRGPAPGTRWQVRWCEGLDALAFFGPLTGQPFYADHYPAQRAAFLPRLASDVVPLLQALAAESDAADTLLWPWLALLCSGGPHDTLAEVLHGVDAAERLLLPPYRDSAYWDEPSWTRFLGMRPRLQRVLRGLQDAGFATFWRQGQTPAMQARLSALHTLLTGLDLVPVQQRMLGRSLPPDIVVSLLQFCRPHGVRVQGQHFLAHVMSSDDTMVLTAAHEILHPPFDMDGPTAQACLAALAPDPLLQRILAEKRRDTGYNTLAGILEEDVVQALDQIIQERLGHGQAPATRWRHADQGMHVLAAALYGMLKADGFDRAGGRIEDWMADAVRGGRLAAASWHAAAAAVLKVPIGDLWVRPEA